MTNLLKTPTTMVIALVGMIGAFWILLIGMVIIAITHDGSIVGQVTGEAQTIGEFLIGGSTALGIVHSVVSSGTASAAATAATAATPSAEAAGATAASDGGFNP